MHKVRRRMVRGLFTVGLLGSIACQDEASPPAGAGTAGQGPAAGGTAIGGAGGTGGAVGGSGVGGEATAQAPVRLVHLLAGASPLEVRWAGETAWSGLGWPSAAPMRAVPVGGALQAWLGDQVVLEGTAALAPGQPAQVSLLGQVGGPTKLLTLAPSTKPGKRVRVVHAAAPLHPGKFTLKFGGWNPGQALSFGQASEWLELPDIPVTSWSLQITTDVRDASFSFSDDLTQPTTLYVASSTTEDLLVYAIGDDGSVTQKGPPSAGTRVTVQHFATGVGAATIEMDGQVMGSAGGAGGAGGVSGVIGWGEQIPNTNVPPHVTEVRAIGSDGKTLAAATYELKNFAQVSFTLAGGPGATTLVPIFERWLHLHPAGETSPQLSFLDARPASVGPSDLSVWNAKGGWSALASEVAPSVVLDLEQSPASSTLLGLDLDRDGSRDLRFRVSWPSSSRTTALFTVAADGVPWLWLPEYGTYARSLPAEFTAALRVVNLTDGLLPFVVAGTPPEGGFPWPAAVSRDGSELFFMLRGPREVTVGETMVTAPFAPLTETALLALPGGTLLPVTTPQQVEEQTVAMQLVNASEEAVSATLDGGKALGTGLGPQQVGPATGGGQEVIVSRADGSKLTYTLPALESGGTSLLVYGGDPAWPSLRVVRTSGQIETLHPRELTGEVQIVAVTASTVNSKLYLDDESDEISSGWGAWQQEPSTRFRYAQSAVPAGAHTLRVGLPPAAIEIPFTVTADTSTRIFVLPDLSTRVLPGLPPGDDVMVLSTVQGSDPSGVLLVDGQDKPAGTLVQGLTFGEVTTVPYPGNNEYPAVDVGGDGKADWRSWLPVQRGSVVMVIGQGTKQAVVCVKGGWAGVVGKALP